MAITIYYEGDFGLGRPTQVEYEGRVVAIRQFQARRNHSDTLDYTDMRPTDCTEALVYRGRVGKASEWDQVVGPLPIEKRFAWVDCTNHMAWRGGGRSVPVVDADMASNTEMAEDHAAWLVWEAEQVRKAEAAKVAAEEARRREAIERPLVGRFVEVVGGRKVPKGTKGFVFWRDSGSDTRRYDDRARIGVADLHGEVQWLDARHARAFEATEVLAIDDVRILQLVGGHYALHVRRLGPKRQDHIVALGSLRDVLASVPAALFEKIVKRTEVVQLMKEAS